MTLDRHEQTQVGKKEAKKQKLIDKKKILVFLMGSV